MELSEEEQAKSANKRTHLTESELQELLELARKTTVHNWCILVLAFNHGMRVSEVAGGAPEHKKRPAVPPIRLCDINLKNRTICIRRSKGSMETTRTQVDLRSNPTMSDTAGLKEYLKACVEDGSGLLFTGTKGPLRRWKLTRMFREYCEKVSAVRVSRGLEPIAEDAMRFHSLKHLCATILASKVSNIFTVKKSLGHASMSSTMLHCAPDMKTACMEAKQVFGQAFSTF